MAAFNGAFGGDRPESKSSVRDQTEMEDDATDESDDDLSLEASLKNIKSFGIQPLKNVNRLQTQKILNLETEKPQKRTGSKLSQESNRGRIGQTSRQLDTAGRTRSHRQRTPRKKESLDKTFLYCLSLKSAHEILLELGSRTDDVVEYLQSQSQPENIKLLLKLLSIACDCESLVEHLLKLLSALKESTFFSTDVANFILDLNLSVSSDDSLRSEFDRTLVNLLIIAKNLLFRLPSSVTVVVGLTEIVESVSDTCSQAVNDSLNEVKSLQKSAFTTFSTNVICVEDEIPPDNFREISIFPTKEDFEQNKQQFLRANKTKKKKVPTATLR